MQIILLRHGKPAIATHSKMSAIEYGRWLDDYNQSSIADACLPADEVVQTARQCDYVVCSHLTRSIDSARALGFTNIDIVDPLFREFEMPFTHWPYPRQSATVWTIMFRLMWLAGYSSNSESFRLAKARAVECVERLEEYARQHERVLFIGHGYLLRYLTKRLIARGWQGPTAAPRKHWALGVYTR